MEKSKSIGLQKAAEELGVNTKTLTKWVLMLTNPSICTVCNKVFPYDFQLKQHMQVEHDGSETSTFLCTDSGNIFPAKNTLKQHEKSENEYKQESQKVKLDKTCKICGAFFKQSAKMKRHLASHSNVYSSINVTTDVIQSEDGGQGEEAASKYQESGGRGGGHGY